MSSNPSPEVGLIHPAVINTLPKITISEIIKSKEEVSVPKPNFLINDVKSKTITFTERQIVILGLLSITKLLVSCVGSIQGPLFPEVAYAKGATATQYGLVFGISKIMCIIASLFYGTNIGNLSPKRTLTGGILTTGISCMIFGLLPNIAGGTNTFIGSCLLVKALEGLGEAAFVTAAFTIIAKEFPNAFVNGFAILETSYGFGLILGPILGGFLYELGGYSLPFLLMGGSLFVMALVNCIVIQTEDSKANCPKEIDGGGTSLRRNIKTLTMWELIKIPAVLMTSYAIAATAIGESFNLALLEPHLRQFKLSKVAICTMFLLCGGVYALTSPIWGYICDKIENPKLITLCGPIFSVVGLSLIGPLPFLPFDTALLVTCGGQVLFGLGTGAVYVSAFVIFLNGAIDSGYPDNVTTYGLVSGLWRTMISLGLFIGPTVGGIIEDHIGFRWGSLVVIGAELIITLMILIFFMKTWLSRRTGAIQMEKLNGITNMFTETS